MADQVDPDRKNPALPHVFQQKLFDLGTDSELLQRTFLQAKVLFRSEFLSIDIEKALELTLEALAELAALHEACERLAKSEQSAIDKMKASPAKDGSLSVPAVGGGIQSECKTFAQKADHFVLKLMDIARLFFPEQKGKNWEDFRALAVRLYGEGDPFCKLLEFTVPVLKLVRNTRDCLEHHLPGAIIRDFEPDPNGGIVPPTIEIDFRGSSLARCLIGSFMEQVGTHLLDTFELLIAHMSAKHMKPFAAMPLSVGLLPENVRAAWHVRFAYGVYDHDGNFVPCG
jgi:hypothetical protein